MAGGSFTLGRGLQLKKKREQKGWLDMCPIYLEWGTEGLKVETSCNSLQDKQVERNGLIGAWKRKQKILGWLDFCGYSTASSEKIKNNKGECVFVEFNYICEYSGYFKIFTDASKQTETGETATTFLFPEIPEAERWVELITIIMALVWVKKVNPMSVPANGI